MFTIRAIAKDLDSGKRHQNLCTREAFWIFTLGSLAPKGLNEEIELHLVIQGKHETVAVS